MLYVVFGVFNQPFVLRVFFVVYWVLDLLLGLYRHIVPVLSTCFPVVLILVLDSQYTSLVQASYRDFVLAESTKILSHLWPLSKSPFSVRRTQNVIASFNTQNTVWVIRDSKQPRKHRKTTTLSKYNSFLKKHHVAPPLTTINH
jgi:hypothetical protein